MTKKHLSLAVIGAGRIGQLHAENLAMRIPSAKLIGIADVNVPAAKTCAERCGIDTVWSHYEDALASAADAVVICSSTDTHAKIIEEAAAAGKHIFCEKPIDHDLGKIDRALNAVRKAGVKLQIGFNRRFDPNFRQIKQNVESGAVGELHIVRITSRDPAPPPIEYVKVSGGMFFDMTIHDFDMARFITSSDVERVYAVGAVKVDKRIGEAGDIDTAVITLEMKSGAIVTIDNSRQAIYGYDQRLEVFGSKGVAAAENNTPHRTVIGDASGFHQPLPLNFFMDRYTESYVQEMREFVQAVLSKTETPVTGDDGRAPVVIAMAATKSLKEARPVALSEIESLALTK
jgi:myo-inositol 2-dehydrogenase / D-chiro-inositol 1-dehydrogenase